jgi:phosphatidylserine/phosphatidylglycerophosphate/cardiolipin synthase-like enzyme
MWAQARSFLTIAPFENTFEFVLWYNYSMCNVETVIGKEYLDKVLPLINEAKSSIKIIIFDFRIELHRADHPTSVLLSALVEARKRGCDVRILVNNIAVRDQLLKLGLHSKRFEADKLLHAKMMLIDDLIAIIGSHNYSLSALTLNHEVSLIAKFDDAPIELVQYFSDLWGV